MSPEKEQRKGYTIDTNMKKVWKIQLNMVTKLLDVCNKHNLRIWADGGTLIGAVREHGYIPWDDDIDMVMFREDYKKLLEVAPAEFKSPYFFQCAYTEKKYYRGHSQLRYDGTAAILYGDIFSSFHQGIFIDIFVLDAMPKNKNLLIDAILKGEKLRSLLHRSTKMIRPYKHPGMLLKVIYAKVFFCFKSPVRVFRQFEETYSIFDGELANDYSSPEFMPGLSFRIQRKKEWYDETLMMPFEDIMIPVPKGYDLILSQQYGDYMTPQKSPSIHGGFAVLDAEHTYLDILPQLRREAMASVIVKIKDKIKTLLSSLFRRLRYKSCIL